jgi:hypothetical protein
LEALTQPLVAVRAAVAVVLALGRLINFELLIFQLVLLSQSEPQARGEHLASRRLGDLSQGKVELEGIAILEDICKLAAVVVVAPVAMQPQVAVVEAEALVFKAADLAQLQAVADLDIRAALAHLARQQDCHFMDLAGGDVLPPA